MADTGDIFSFEDDFDPMLYLSEDSGTGGSAGASSGMSMSTGLSILGTAGKIAGTLMEGKEKKQADEYNAALVREQGIIEQYQLGQEEVGTLSAARAMTAKAGLTQSGSPLDAALKSASGFELDKQIANYNTQSRANMYDWEGKMAMKNAKFSAGMQAAEGAMSLAMVLL